MHDRVLRARAQRWVTRLAIIRALAMTPRFSGNVPLSIAPVTASRLADTPPRTADTTYLADPRSRVVTDNLTVAQSGTLRIIKEPYGYQSRS